MYPRLVNGKDNNKPFPKCIIIIVYNRRFTQLLEV
jgi:hypothetical protein